MKPEIVPETYFELLEEDGVQVSQVRKEKIRTYAQRLLDWNTRINLVSRADPAKTILHNLVFSAQFIKALSGAEMQTGKIADFGTGGGFPGIPLAIFFPEIKIDLIDSVRKKILVLNKIKSELNLNVNPSQKFLEVQKKRDEIKYSAVTALAFTSLQKLIALAQTRVKRKGFLLTLKGVDYMAEMDGNWHAIKSIEINDKWYKLCQSLKDKRLLILEF